MKSRARTSCSRRTGWSSTYEPGDPSRPPSVPRSRRACCRHPRLPPLPRSPRGPPLPHEPRPVLRVSATARIGIFSQAPGTRVHASGTPFTDPSGVRLRAWMGVTDDEFYDASRIAIVPMGFCFPGLDAKGGDLPPRRECAPLWRARLMAALPDIELVLLVGQYAQRWHLGADARPGSPTLSAAGARSLNARASDLGAAAASVLAQQRLDQAPPLVRGGVAAVAAGGSGEETLAAVGDSFVSGRSPRGELQPRGSPAAPVAAGVGVRGIKRPAAP